ncbi:hypothetical protein QTP70_026575 [Hemibagrus guttatus]|uniref:ribonuclease H n=1 Tax=Hemibagrus guttatus TaxID=175788 RepID=A0AAE0VG91_9TELE|nr:hypothetical protein QTP70_026575 [Hemibagrus guttatus]
MGKFGVKERNLEGQMVVDFAKRMDMAVVNTYFQKREEHRVTYKSGDLEKVYDRVPREELWYCMRKSGVTEKYVRVVQDMYERSRTVVRCAVGQTEEFKVEVGLHQVSALSPFLFAIVMDHLSEEVRQESPWTMMFADDIVICNESRKQVEENLERWRFALERRGMKVSHIQSNGECGKEVKKRVQAGWNGWRKVSVRDQGEGVQDSGETGHDVWFRDSVTEEETGVRARGFESLGPPPMTTQNTLHQTLMLLPAGGGPKGRWAYVRTVPGRVPQAKTRPPGARLHAPTPGLAPEWGPSDANLGDVTVLDVVLFIRVLNCS